MENGKQVRSVGLDIGKNCDHLALVETERLVGSRRMDVVNVAEFPLHMPYPVMIEHIEEIVNPAHVMMLDANGVGQVVFDYLRDTFTRCWAVTTTGGLHTRVNQQKQTISIPKHIMVEQLIAAIGKGEFRIKMNGHADVLLQQLKDLEGRPGTKFIHYEAKPGCHDDVVMAAALSKLGMGVEGLVT